MADDTVLCVTNGRAGYPSREYLRASPLAGSYRGLMLALCAAAREVDVPVDAFGASCPSFGTQEAMWALPAGVRPGPQPDKGLYPPVVRVRLPVRDPHQARSQLIAAVSEAASHDWYRPTEAGVAEPLASMWPQLRDRGPRTEGLAHKLATMTDLSGTEGSVEWFHNAGEAAAEAAFLAGAPVIVSGYLITGSGSCASMTAIIPRGAEPRSVSIGVARGDTVEASVSNAVEVLLRGYGIEPGTEQYEHKARYLAAAMLASAEPVPDTASTLTR